VLVRCRLAPDVALDRQRLREIRRELLRAEALGAAARVLSGRDVSERRLRERLASRGVGAEAAESALATLASAGVVDDARLVRARATSLCERGWGDAAIGARLEQEGLSAELVDDALAVLPPESRRAAAVATRAPDRRAAWRLLARRGFSPEAMEDALGSLDEGA
jgi:SOS response regulatory protein OraA/RecX